MTMQETRELNGKRIVVIEDDFLLAADMCRELRELGATVLGPAPTPFYAMQLINNQRIDAAVLDIRLHGTTVFEVADRLRSRGVPILFATGFNRDDLPVRFKGTPWLSKPWETKQLLAQIQDMIQRPQGSEVDSMKASAPTPPVEHWPPVQTFARALAMRLGKD